MESAYLVVALAAIAVGALMILLRVPIASVLVWGLKKFIMKTVADSVRSSPFGLDLSRRVIIVGAIFITIGIGFLLVGDLVS